MVMKGYMLLVCTTWCVITVYGFTCARPGRP